MTPDVEVTREIAATPEAVFQALTDVTRMGEWSPETDRAAWIDGHDGPAEGAMFEGHNRIGDKEWTTQARVAEFVENERFVFHCLFRDYHFASWGYGIEPTESGCRVTEYWQDLRPEESRNTKSKISGVTDRVSHNRLGMEQTLERLAAALE